MSDAMFGAWAAHCVWVLLCLAVVLPLPADVPPEHDDGGDDLDQEAE